MAKECYELFKQYVPKDSFYVEPSAGDGSFLNIICEEKIGFDISPDNDSIIQNDYLKSSIKKYIKNKKNVVILGNPPFGKKSKLAISFLNKSFQYSSIVGFVVPIQFRKWSVQNQIREDAKLILDHDIPKDSFLVDGKPYDVNCCFQIWSLEGKVNLRTSPPITSSSDFQMFQYNRTDESLKYFDYEWDFAVIRQGYHDYSKKYYKKEDCNSKQQWIFFKAKNKKILKRLLSLDFEKLSKKNTSTPGFGKADVIEEYNKLYERKTNSKILAMFE